MSGRGCVISVKVLGGATGSGDNEELSLPVALHSPLEVLKDQFTEIVGIPPADQVVILCDLSDPDRNNDVLLMGRDHMSLHACGIRDGSVLTLHALGVSAERKQALMKEALAKKQESEDMLTDKVVYSLSSEIQPAQANHRCVKFFPC